MLIRVIDEQGAQLGLMPPQQAIEIARAKGLDLVEVAAQAVPPVCRIVDFGKWQYEQKKKVKGAKAKQAVTVKEIMFRPGTGEHDYNFKKDHAAKILRGGDRVKATVHFRGREVAHKELGNRLLVRLETDLADAGAVEVRPHTEGAPKGMNMFIILAPKRNQH
jgi:translation initiation factor IF-3